MGKRSSKPPARKPPPQRVVATAATSSGNRVTTRPAGAPLELSRAAARRFMQMAIDAMRSSVPERRGDGKVAPQVGAAPMLSRNPILHYVFAKMELAEERGLGLKSMRTRAAELGLPLPTYRWDAPYLVLRVLRSAGAATRLLSDDVRAKLSTIEVAGWEWFVSRGRSKSSEYAEAQGIAERVARRHLNHFVSFGLARKVGGARATSYEVVR